MPPLTVNMPPLARFQKLDVNQFQVMGLEPCAIIFAKVAELRPGEGLLITASFLPSPLIEKLQGEGFVSRVERGAGRNWRVYLWPDPTKTSVGP